MNQLNVASRTERNRYIYSPVADIESTSQLSADLNISYTVFNAALSQKLPLHGDT